jgi:WS/DGAT/MGAT family acyltransferase
MWLVEGLEDGRVAIITKAHHCMIDGVGSVELMGALMSPTADPDPRLDEPAPRWTPRPRPQPAALLASELLHRATAPLEIARNVVRAPITAMRSLPGVVGGVASAIAAGLRSASPTPLNVAIGPHRRFDWASMDLNVLKDVRSRLEGTVNDVVLSMLSGALGRFLVRRGVPVENLDFRAMVPVNVRTDATRGHIGNQVAMMVVRLPLEERDPRRRLARVVAETRRAKTSSQAAGMQAIEELSDRTFTTLLTQFARLAALSRPYNVVVTNVPGPTFPVHVLGARMSACYPLVPLFENQALGIALFSYDGALYWGFNTDWDVLPDVHELIDGVYDEYAALCTVARIGDPACQASQRAS